MFVISILSENYSISFGIIQSLRISYCKKVLDKKIVPYSVKVLLWNSYALVLNLGKLLPAGRVFTNHFQELNVNFRLNNFRLT